MENETNAEAYARTYARTITVEVEASDDPWHAATDYVADALDANYVVASQGDVTEVHLIVGTGGPHVEVQHRTGTEGVMVRVWWWQDYAEAFAHAPALAAELDALAEAWQAVTVMAGVRR